MLTTARADNIDDRQLMTVTTDDRISLLPVNIII